MHRFINYTENANFTLVDPFDLKIINKFCMEEDLSPVDVNTKFENCSSKSLGATGIFNFYQLCTGSPL